MKKFWRDDPTFTIFGLVLILRLLAIAVARYMHVLPIPLEYEVVADNWLSGKGFVYFHHGTWYKSFLNPLYCFLCIAVYALFGHHQLLVLFMQAVFAGLLCVTVYHIGAMIDKRTGMVAAFFTMIHPGIFYYDVFYLHSLSMDAFLFAFICFILLRLSTRPSFSGEILTGAALGIQMYERGTIAFFILPAFIWLRYFSAYYKENRVKWIRGCLVITIVMTAVIAPWTIRNFMIHKELVPVCTPLAEILWRGNNPLATGTAYNANGTPMFFASPPEFQKKITGLGEMDQVHVFRKEAFSFIKAHPGRFIMLTLNKIKIFWWFSPLTGIEYKFKPLWLIKALYAVMILISIGGIVSMAKRKAGRGPVILILIALVTVTLGQSLFYVQQKHRWSIEPLLFIFTAHGVVSFSEFFLKKVQGKNAKQ